MLYTYTYAVIIALVFMLNVTLFMAVDNIQLHICTGLSPLHNYICMFVIFFVILYLLLWEWYSERKKPKDVPVEDSSDLVGSRDDIPLDSINQDAYQISSRV